MAVIKKYPERAQVNLTLEDKKLIREVAERLGLSEAAVVRRLIEKPLENLKETGELLD